MNWRWINIPSPRLFPIKLSTVLIKPIIMVNTTFIRALWDMIEVSENSCSLYLADRACANFSFSFFSWLSYKRKSKGECTDLLKT